MRSSRLFLVAPHSFCNERNKVRHCDRYAKPAIDALKLTGGSRICGVHVSDAFRKSDFDYNRPMTDATPWRNHMRDLIAEARPDFVLEIHSFPGDHPVYNHWGRADLVLYQSPANARFVGEMRDKIAAAAPNMTIGIQSPDHPVAITDDMATLGIPHTLFEFNEDMPAENLRVLSRAIISVFDECGQQACNWSRERVGGFVVATAGIAAELKKIFPLVIAILIIILIALVFQSPASTVSLFQPRVAKC